MTLFSVESYRGNMLRISSTIFGWDQIRLLSPIVETVQMSPNSSPSTKTLDHIVHLTPPGTFHDTAEQFRQLGFKFGYFFINITVGPANINVANQRHRRRNARQWTDSQLTRREIPSNPAPFHLFKEPSFFDPEKPRLCPTAPT